ncbi:MAG: hypothetical protein U5L02_06400 [Rheinheimera sp.]|nr:hypothetical protein [Rheinheimera sp.]
MTRAKTDAAISQLDDMLHPNTDKNWGIKITPVPELSELLDSTDEAEADGQKFAFEDGKTVTKGDIAKRQLQKMQDACTAMEKEIHDQLTECRYSASARVAISDACIVGTGILKGPVISRKMDLAFVQKDGQYIQEEKESFVPIVEVVRPWDFYPDPSAATIEEADYVFERRYMSKRQLRALAKRKGFSPENVERAIELSPQQTQHKASFQDDVRKLAGMNDTLNDSRYETWEYHGPIRVSVLIELGLVKKPEGDDDAVKLENQEVDAIVFYCGGVVLGAKSSLIKHHSDYPYRVFNWAQNDACIFGSGIPRIVIDEQSVLNTVWRMILDNGAATAGPQIGLNKKYVKPMNDDWTFTPFKIWEIEGTATDIKQAFSTFETSSHLNELSAIYQTARVLFDEVSGVPMIQQGEQGQSTQTLGGMSMLMNAANTVRRRQVRMWDDCITTPLITDFYHFNMLFSKKNEIKGDYQVDAKGTSALLVKETQAQAITNLMSVVGSNQVFQPVLALKAPQILRAWARTQSLPDDILPTDDELRSYQQRIEEEQKGQPQDPALAVEQMRIQQQQAKFEHETQLEQFKAQQRQQEMQFEAGLKLQLAAAQERIEMAKLAQEDKHNTESLMTELKKVQSEHAANWQQFMAEVQIKKQAGLTANYGLDPAA